MFNKIILKYIMIVTLLLLTNSANAQCGIYVFDQFNSQAYNLNNGAVNWETNWSELSDDGLPNSGDVTIDPINNYLKMHSTGSGVFREVDLSAASSAVLTFDIESVDNGNDTYLAEISFNGGTNYALLEQFNPVGSSGNETLRQESKSYTLTSGSLSADVIIRFRVTAGYSDVNGQFASVDNVKIDYCSTLMTRSSQINSINDDVEEEGPDGASPGTINVNSTDLELVYDPNSSQGIQIVGMRFNNLNIPQGAVITDAYITFTSDDPTSDPGNPSNSSATTLSIAGQDIDNAPVFSTTNSDVSTRTMTTASVNWSPTSWTTNTTYNTSSLTTIVKEIVDRPGWNSGNSMAMIVTGTDVGGRVAHSYDGVPASAPILFVTYALEEICGNGLDDDGDGLVDCEDPDCSAYDWDGDTICDGTDLDDDNDGILNSEEKCGPPAILSWTEAQIDSDPSNIVTTLAGNPVIINAVVISSSGTNPSFGGDSYNYSGSVTADAGMVLNGDVQLSLYQNNFENITKVTFNITPDNFGNLNLFICDAEITDLVVYAEDASANRLSTVAWDVTSYEQNGTTPASDPNPYTVNTTDISFGPPPSNSQNDDAMRLRFDTETLTKATKIVVEATKSVLGIGDNMEIMLTSSCPNNDTDDDGIPDYLDLDSDNDGIYDAVESGSGEAQTAGLLNGGVDTDGIPLSVSNGASGVNYTYADTDSDGILNPYDSDSDGDTCPDVIEAGFPDSDGDQQLGGLVPPTVDSKGVVTSGGL